MNFQNSLLWIGGIGIAFAWVLYFANYNWFSRFARLLLIPVWIIIGIAKFFAPKIIASIIFLVVSILVILSWIITVPSTILGARLSDRISTKGLIKPLQVESKQVKKMMLDFISGNLSLEIESTEADYRSELEDLRESAENRIEIGEKVLTIFVGIFVLLLSVFPHWWIFQNSLQSPVLLILQIYILLMSISVVTRTFSLDFVLLDGTEDFDDLSIVRAGVRYQKGMLKFSRLQPLFLMMIFVSFLSTSNEEIAFDALNNSFDPEKPQRVWTIDALREAKDLYFERKDS